jgi:uncharacterized membrane protein/thiol-disulfide isomerase/thioredoxin
MSTTTYILNKPIKPFGLYLLLLSTLIIFMPTPVTAKRSIDSPNTVIVRAVLFYSPACGHCQKVIEEDLPPIVKKYEEQLEIIVINITTPEGNQLFQAAAEYYKDIREIRGVPTMIVGDQVLIGDLEIPEQLPSIIDTGLAEGGIDWPTFPGLSDVLQYQPTPKSLATSTITATTKNLITGTNSSTPEPTEDTQPTTESITASLSLDPTSPSEQPIYVQKFLRDPYGNTSAVLTLIGMIISVIVVAYYFLQAPGETSLGNLPRWFSWPNWLIPATCIAGLFVAGYMSYVELTHTEAICGPLGDCNSVQQSSYATLWGFLPVGVLGIIGYVSIGTIWLLYRNSPLGLRKLLSLLMWGMALLGTLFSIYLTFLEPFVIGATCAWCLSSAILITLLLWATTGRVLQEMAMEEKARIAASES